MKALQYENWAAMPHDLRMMIQAHPNYSRLDADKDLPARGTGMWQDISASVESIPRIMRRAYSLQIRSPSSGRRHKRDAERDSRTHSGDHVDDGEKDKKAILWCTGSSITIRSDEDLEKWIGILGMYPKISKGTKCHVLMFEKITVRKPNALDADLSWRFCQSSGGMPYTRNLCTGEPGVEEWILEHPPEEQELMKYCQHTYVCEKKISIDMNKFFSVHEKRMRDENGD